MEKIYRSVFTLYTAVQTIHRVGTEASIFAFETDVPEEECGHRVLQTPR